jgi:hypothetical protein
LTRQPVNRLSPANVNLLRHLVERTALPYRAIAEETGFSTATVSRYVRAEGWRRPEDAPTGKLQWTRTRQVRLLERLFRLVEVHITELEEVAQERAAAAREERRRSRTTRSLPSGEG